MLKDCFYNGKRIAMRAVLPVSLLMLASCGGNGDSAGNYPKDFATMNDSQKVAYMMQNVTPDSVARFICDAALGKNSAKINSLSEATLHAYENYKDADLQTFSTAYDEYAESLPLNEKMRLRKLAAQDDPMGLGYELGLEYVNMIRVDHKSAAQVEKEIAALKSECQKNPEDSLTFGRFMKGFKVALEVDGSADVPREIYNKYVSDRN